MDATYGTNNAGLYLYAVLAELGRTRIPIAYLFFNRVGTNKNAVWKFDANFGQLP